MGSLLTCQFKCEEPFLAAFFAFSMPYRLQVFQEPNLPEKNAYFAARFCMLS